MDYRLSKLQTLPAVSRSVILGRAKELQDGKESNFRSFTHLELEWQEKTNE